MGNIRQKYIKNISKKLVETYPDLFSGDWEKNKKIVQEITNVSTKTIRNHIAGYITRYWKMLHRRTSHERTEV